MIESFDLMCECKKGEMTRVILVSFVCFFFIGEGAIDIDSHAIYLLFILMNEIRRIG